MDELWRIGRRIQEVRDKVGFTQDQLAERLSITPRYLRWMEANGTKDLLRLKEIADALNVNLLQLLPEEWYISPHQKELINRLSNLTHQLHHEADLFYLLQIAEKLVSKQNKLP